MARAQALRLGPFVGGLNLASDPTAVADSELVSCINFELDIDGSLHCRPPIKETTGVGAGSLVIIGRATLAGVNYVITGRASGGIYAFNGTTHTTIHATLKSKVAVQFRDNLYIVPAPGTKATQNGGRWDGTTFTADANMPEGEAAVFHKNRMFICPGENAVTNLSQLRYSDTITAVALTWNALNVIEVHQGDGENLVDICISNDNLLLFKNDSTYVLAYDISPADAIVRTINPNIGASAYRCVVQYENSTFTFHEGRVYEITNYDFNKINIKVPFVYDALVPATFTRIYTTFLSVVGDRLIVRYHNKIYVYGLKTRTWSEWQSALGHLHNIGPFTQFPTNSVTALPKYYCASALDVAKLFVVQDGYDDTTVERLNSGTTTITCKMTTKNFDFADSHHFKKLLWWGADLLTSNDVIGSAFPIISSYQATWDNLSGFTWADLAANTWSQPNIVPATVSTTVVDPTSVMRKFEKFLKALRFRQIYFGITMTADGSTTSGPCKVFTLTAIVASKETVGKQVN